MSVNTTSQNAKREVGKWFKIIIRPEHHTSPKKLLEDITYFCLKYFALVIQGCDYCTEPDIVLVINYFEVFGGGTRLAMPKTICAPDTSSLKPGSGATEGVLD